MNRGRGVRTAERLADGTAAIQAGLAMRTFTCFIHDGASSVPTLSVILAADEARARELARREMREARRPLAIEVFEANRLLFIERGPGDATDGYASQTRHFDGVVPDEISRCLNAQKILCLGLDLADEAEPNRPEVKDRLLEEENRFAAFSEKLDSAERLIAAAKLRVATQRRLVERLEADGESTELALTLLERFEQASELFSCFAAEVEQELQAVEL